MSATDRNNESDWHLDKRVPISIIAMMIGQIFVGGMVYAEIKASVADHERRIRIAEETDARREAELKGVGGRLAALEENSKSTLRLLERIEGRLDGLTMRQMPQHNTPPQR